MKNISKVIIYNLITFLILITIFEMIFGYFLKPDNFG